MDIKDALFNVRCPHCNKATVAAVSGFCRSGFNTRVKRCQGCERDFTLVVYAEVSLQSKYDDEHLAALKSRIKDAKRQKKIEKVALEGMLYTVRLEANLYAVRN